MFYKFKNKFSASLSTQDIHWKFFLLDFLLVLRFAIESPQDFLSVLRFAIESPQDFLHIAEQAQH